MRPTPVTLHEGARAHPERVRFRTPAPLTWADIDAAVREVGLWLEGVGLERERPVAVFAPNRIEWLYAALGIQAAGGVMVPIYPSSTAAQAGYVLRHSGALAAFVDSQALLERVMASGAADGLGYIVLLGGGHDVAAAVEAARASGVEISDDLLRRVLPLEQVRERGRSLDVNEAYGQLLSRLVRADRCLMLYTSGTTGHPKGVPLTWDNVNSNSEDWIEVLGPALPELRVDLFWLPMSHIFGWGEACLGFELGFESYLTTPAEVLELFATVRPTIFMSVPAYWEKLAAGALEAPDRERRKAKLLEDVGGRLAFCLSGGAGLDRRVKETFEEAGLLIIEGYGLTEAAPTLTMNRPSDYRFDSVGKAFPRVELKLAEDGEILARGPNVFGGYHDDAEATSRAFTAEGWLATGDLGRLTEDGFLQIIGRKKEILVTAGGKNIPPANIELAFASDDLIEHLVVYGDGKKYLVAGVWLSPVARRENPDLIGPEVDRRIEAVNATLARHETIKKHCIMQEPLTVEAGLLTPTLKIKRSKVYDAFRASFEGLYA